MKHKLKITYILFIFFHFKANSQNLEKIFYNKKDSNIEKQNLILAYNTAISDFIKIIKKELNQKHDTLYFGKHQYGNSDDFPEIELQRKIENSEIILISPEKGEFIQKSNPSNYYINLISWIDSSRAEFNFVVFSKGFKHQYDCKLIYKKTPNDSSFLLKKFKIDLFSN